jgi:hypothetical protein
LIADLRRSYYRLPELFGGEARLPHRAPPAYLKGKAIA